MVKERNKYSPNCVYIVKIDNGNYYVGCHTRKDATYLTESNILTTSGNPLKQQYAKKEISLDEYYSRVELINVFNCSSKEEALDLEVEMIKTFKLIFRERCLNYSLGNKYGRKGVKQREESKKLISLHHADYSGENNPCYGRTGNKHPNYGRVWYNNGEETIYISKDIEVPEGFVKGRLFS